MRSVEARVSDRRAELGCLVQAFRVAFGSAWIIASPAFFRMPRPHHQLKKSPHSQTRNPKHTKLRKTRVTFKGTEGARARQIRTAAAIQAAAIAP
jgi:hypothetical protein